jgi:hypothetical protein
VRGIAPHQAQHRLDETRSHNDQISTPPASTRVHNANRTDWAAPRAFPRQMALASQEIQLVAVVSVAAGDDDEEDGHESTNGYDRPSFLLTGGGWIAAGPRDRSTKDCSQGVSAGSARRDTRNGDAVTSVLIATDVMRGRLLRRHPKVRIRGESSACSLLARRRYHAHPLLARRDHPVSPALVLASRTGQGGVPSSG